MMAGTSGNCTYRSNATRNRVGQVAVTAHHHVVEVEPAGEPAQLDGQLLGRLRRGAVLGERARHEEGPVGAVGLEVDPRHEPVAQQEREHVVAVQPLLGGDVDLDAVEEVEERLGARPLPHHRVERAQQGARADPPRQPGVAVEVGLPLPALHRHRGQLPRLDQLVDRDLRARLAGRRLEAQAVVVGQAAAARDAVRARGTAYELGDRVLRRRGGRVEDGGGQHPLGDVVERPRTGCCAPRSRRRPRGRGSRAPCATPTSSSPSCSLVRGPVLNSSSRSRAVTGPRSRTASSTRGSRSASAVKPHLPRSERYFSIRCRISGHRSTGIRAWTCAQYSTTRRGRRSAARRSRSTS